MSDLTNLIEWNRWADEGKTLLEVLTILNNRHREEVGRVEGLARELRDALDGIRMVVPDHYIATPRLIQSNEALTKAEEANL